ncbi:MULTISPECIES: enoyl-ACP reductase FabV [Corallincola]|uniref:Enoyl-[acyl-carrier-protein] reductase [NADH] n=2 Tax=Corallincola TaxID=1775176 RepID=A0A368NN65_9GAMM|nr:MULTISPECIES: enoyl-ACP reductase FabV [Corallincola]RCU50909.1 trans-2-enoyl-CoA reductase family protein [Corallincola holothuriorum]TAA45863.1 trans-2-enoyl-CoA reductase family protein [Corallincola spongiicola]
MVIKPKIRGFICTNSHPAGCAANVQEQIAFTKAQGAIANGPKKVLVIGASTGYGMASRITAAFGCGAATLGIFFEKPGTVKRTASAGWYNSAAFQSAADEAGLYSKNINGDAFSDEIKQKTIEVIKQDLGQVDMVVYSLASPRRTDPKTGETFTSTLKPIGQAYTARTLNTDKLEVHEMTLEPATEQEIADTVKVMGGEDWELWLDALSEAGVLAENVETVAYSYIGKELTWPIYGKATIGKAKEDLDRAAAAITGKLSGLKGQARVSVLKALVTQASSAIPIMPLYISLLYKVMKEEGSHEGCIEQIQRLFQQVYVGPENLDEDNRLRVDDKELAPHVQAAVADVWPEVTTENYNELTDYRGYHADFLKLFGFGVTGVDYEADADPEVEMPLA